MKTSSISVLFLSLAHSAFAVEPSGLRYATLADCAIDGAASTDAIAQNTFETALAKSGAIFVDVAQSRASRAGIDIPGLARGGDAPDAVLAIDADVVVALAIRANSDSASKVISSSGLTRYQATIEASLIAVDTGERLARFSLNKFAIDHDARNAKRWALQRVGEALADEVLKSDRDAERVEIWIRELPLSDVERVRDALRRIQGAKSARVLFSSSALTKVSLVVDASMPRGAELAEAIQRATDTGLVITQVSDRVLQAEFAARHKVLFTYFAGNKPKAGANLARLIGDGMRDAPFLVEAAPDPIDLGRSVREREKKLGALGLLDATALFLGGSYEDRGNAIDIMAEVRGTRRGFELIARDRETCASAELSRCTAELAARLLKKLPEALQRRRLARPIEPDALSLVQLTFEERLFPARAHFYEAHGFGKAILENRGKVPARGGTVRVELAGVDPVSAVAPDVEPGQRIEVSLPFTSQSYASKSANAALRVDISYDVDGRRESLTQTGVARILPTSALVWSEPESIAAFISDPTDATRLLAASALEQVPLERRGDPVARAAALFYLHRGLRYLNDRIFPGEVREIDEVQFPVETLKRGSGDCDDFAVLFAALAQASSGDANTLLVLTRGHILPAFDTGLPAQSARKISFDPNKVIVHGGRVFIPIETTSVDRSFAQAWGDAAERIAAAKRDHSELQIIEVRKAWEMYPPVAFAPSDSSGIKHKPSFVGLKEELEALAKLQANAIDGALSQVDATSLDPRALSDRASLFVLFGRASEAIELLEGGVARFPRVPELANNLANAHLARQEPDAALALYRAAAAKTKAPERAVRIRLNAAFAAHMKGGLPLFQEYLIEAVEHARTEKAKAVIHEFWSDFGARMQMKNESAQSFAVHLRERFEASPVLRASNVDGAKPISIAEIVYWLEPEVSAK